MAPKDSQTATGLVGGHVCPMDAEAIERALVLAVAAAPQVRATSSHDRAVVLDKIAAALSQDAGTVAQALADESGYLTRKDMELEVQRAIEVFTLTAAYVRTGMSESINLDAVERARGAVGYIRREPIGPILGITAYNGPLLIATHKISAAVAAGAPIVLKPSPRVPQATIALAQRVIAAGWNADAISVLNVDNDATMQLVKDARLPVISFTGGEIGWAIKDMAPRKHVHLELGGVGAVLIAADANIEMAAKECAAAGFVRSGQSCISVQRIYVEKPVHDAFVKLFVKHVEDLMPGKPGGISPMVDENAAKKVEVLIAEATGKGATVACGGVRNGAQLQPTVLTGAKGSMKVMRQEAFGPVVAIEAVDSIADAVAEVNAVSGSIHHGVYTANIDTAFMVTNQIKAAGVIVNGPGTWRVDHMPYGGTGTSGFGREGVRYAVEEFTEPKTIVVRPSRPS